mmetsp:Transcript_10827/g.20269  ORF Transcript_10827/g.20269 Transcript_10827/m.20269 type:complete len:203 (+) Transcript_10827:92-700(+)
MASMFAPSQGPPAAMSPHGHPGGMPPGQLGGPGMPPPGAPPQSPMGPGAGGSQPLTMVAPASSFSGEAGRYPWYRVAFVGGVDLRQGPSVEAPRTGETLCQNATFAAAEELAGADGRFYLRLADGRGWAFDDSALFPHDPSVIRGYWQPISLAPAQPGATPQTQAGAPQAPPAPQPPPQHAQGTAAVGHGSGALIGERPPWV